MLQFACSVEIFSHLLWIYRFTFFLNDFVSMHLEKDAQVLLGVTPGLSWK